MMGPGRTGPPPPIRDVWADDVKASIASLREQISQLETAIKTQKDKCNHTFKDGKSALQLFEDAFDDYSHTNCAACNSIVR